MKTDFHKLVGAGNDFIFIEHTKIPERIKKPPLVKHLCDRKWGVGADGVAFLKKKGETGHSFSWDFYNNDGSQAEMCGNAALCSVLYLKELRQVESFNLKPLWESSVENIYPETVRFDGS